MCFFCYRTFLGSFERINSWPLKSLLFVPGQGKGGLDLCSLVGAGFGLCLDSLTFLG